MRRIIKLYMQHYQNRCINLLIIITFTIVLTVLTGIVNAERIRMEELIARQDAEFEEQMHRYDIEKKLQQKELNNQRDIENDSGYYVLIDLENNEEKQLTIDVSDKNNSVNNNENNTEKQDNTAVEASDIKLLRDNNLVTALVLNKDGTGLLDILGETSNLTWDNTTNTITLLEADNIGLKIDSMQYRFITPYSELELTQGNSKLIFTKTAPNEVENSNNIFDDSNDYVTTPIYNAKIEKEWEQDNWTNGEFYLDNNHFKLCETTLNELVSVGFNNDGKPMDNCWLPDNGIDYLGTTVEGNTDDFNKYDTEYITLHNECYPNVELQVCLTSYGDEQSIGEKRIWLISITNICTSTIPASMYSKQPEFIVYDGIALGTNSSIIDSDLVLNDYNEKDNTTLCMSTLDNVDQDNNNNSIYKIFYSKTL